MTGPTWTILIATLGQRRDHLDHLLAGLMPQVEAAAGRVNVLAAWDNGETDLATKRQKLLEAATGEYVCFVDDDDTLSDDYVPAILEALESRPDYVGFWMMVHREGRPDRLSQHSLQNQGWSDGTTHYLRDVTHENPMRTDLARQADFRDKPDDEPEDRPWSAKVREVLAGEVFVDRVLYHYSWEPAKSTWTNSAGLMRGTNITRTDLEGRPWEPLAVASPLFAYLPGMATGTGADLLVIVPTRSRPHNIERLLRAWDATGAWGVADLLIAADADDPALPGYQALALPFGARLTVADVWRPMVHKLNHEATRDAGLYFAVAFMGDDHEPITEGWAQRYLDALRALGSGIVYCRDDYQDDKLPTQWALTADIVRLLGNRMTPAPVEHLYCDNAILDLGRAAGCIDYLPDVLIRHNHYLNGFAPSDDQYQAVNSHAQYGRDRPAYQRWLKTGLASDTTKVATLRFDRPAVGLAPLWTILIPTLGQRGELFARLLDRLMPQVDAAGGTVKVLAYWNNGEKTLPDIRQTLVEAVTTPYLSFVDDDDMVEEDYVKVILEALASRPDFVGFDVQCYTDGEPQGVAHHALKYKRWHQNENGLFRDISHVNPMRTDAARRVTFRVARAGQAEDRLWVQQMRRHRRLRTEVVIERVLYHYLWSGSVSAWRRPARSIKKGQWEPLRPESPHFSYHRSCAAAQR